ELINTYFNLTELHLSLNDAAKVGNTYDRFVQLLERRANAFPQVLDYKHELGVVLNDYAKFLLRRDKLVEAGRYFREAIHSERAAVQGDPQKAPFRQALCASYLGLVDTLVQLEDHAGAAQAVADLLAVAPANWPDYPRAAALLARCIRLAEQD